MYDVSRFTTTHVATSDAIFCQKIVAFHAGLRFFFPLPTSAVLSESIVYIYICIRMNIPQVNTLRLELAPKGARYVLIVRCYEKEKSFFLVFFFVFFSVIFFLVHQPALHPPPQEESWLFRENQMVATTMSFDDHRSPSPVHLSRGRIKKWKRKVRSNTKIKQNPPRNFSVSSRSVSI